MNKRNASSSESTLKGVKCIKKNKRNVALCELLTKMQVCNDDYGNSKQQQQQNRKEKEKKGKLK